MTYMSAVSLESFMEPAEPTLSLSWTRFQRDSCYQIHCTFNRFTVFGDLLETNYLFVDGYV